MSRRVHRPPADSRFDDALEIDALEIIVRGYLTSGLDLRCLGTTITGLDRRRVGRSRGRGRVALAVGR